MPCGIGSILYLKGNIREAVTHLEEKIKTN